MWGIRVWLKLSMRTEQAFFGWQLDHRWDIVTMMSHFWPLLSLQGYLHEIIWVTVLLNIMFSFVLFWCWKQCPVVSKNPFLVRRPPIPTAVLCLLMVPGSYSLLSLSICCFYPTPTNDDFWSYPCPFSTKVNRCLRVLPANRWWFLPSRGASHLLHSPPS